MSGHTGAVLEMHFTPDGSQLYTASTDHTLGLWDIVTGQRIKKFKGHTTFVNTVQGARRGPQSLVSGSDDSTIKTWDTRKKNCVSSINTTYQVILFDELHNMAISNSLVIQSTSSEVKDCPIAVANVGRFIDFCLNKKKNNI